MINVTKLSCNFYPIMVFLISLHCISACWDMFMLGKLVFAAPLASSVHVAGASNADPGQFEAVV
jgi:hypothetical protein